MSVEESILNIITASVNNDYYTAGIKTEVVIDTLITPVITCLIKEMLEKNDKKDEVGDLLYITKEFPMLKKDVFNEDGKGDYSNNKADFLLKDKNNIYLVELKTSIDSIDEDQIVFYYKYIQRINNAPKALLAEFMALFNSVSNTGIGDETYRKKMKEYIDNSNNDKHNEISLKNLKSKVFERYKKKNKNEIEILRINGDSSSKKYLIQATEIEKALPDDMEDTSYKNISMIKLIYIVPDKKEFLKKCKAKKISMTNIIVCGLNDLEYDSECDRICRYYNWLKKEILNPIFK